MKEVMLPLILQYLRQNNYIDAFLILEEESKTFLNHYPKEVQFLRKILMKGHFSKAVDFLWTLNDKLNEDNLNQFSLLLYKQKLYQLLENPIQAQLRVLFEKEIINFCSQEEYQQLFTMLTCRSAKELDRMEEWSVMRGRFQCFQKIYPAIEPLFMMGQQRNDIQTSTFTLQQAVEMFTKKDSNIPIRNRIKTNDQEQTESKIFINREKGKPQNPLRQFQKDMEEVEIYESKVQKMQASTFSKKINPYMNEKLDQSQESRVPPISYSHKTEDEHYRNEVKRNIAYLENNNQSHSYQQADNEHFTFSHGTQDQDKNRKVLKLASVSDSKAIRTCQFSQTGNYFAIGTNSSYLKIFDITNLFEMNTPCDISLIYQIPQLHSKSIFCLDWSANEKALLTCSNDLTIKVTEFPDGFDYGSHKTSNIGRHESCIRMVKFNSMENQIVSCGDDSLIKVWDLGKNKKCTSLKGHTQSVSAFKFGGQQDQFLYSVSKDSTIRKWDMRMNQCVRVSSPQQSEMTYIANHIDRIVVSHKNGCVSFFNDDLKLQQSFQIHEQEIRSIDGLTYDDTLLTASFDGHISLFNFNSLESPNYHQHNEVDDDKVVYATFLNHPEYRGFASTSTMGLCNIFSYE